MENCYDQKSKDSVQKKYHWGLIIAGVVGAVAVLLLGVVNLKNVLNCCWVSRLKANLDFIGEFINRYPWLIIIAILVFIWYKLNRNFTINASTVNVLGCDLQFRNSEDSAKTQIKNHLSSKRSLFSYSEEFDNYYDVINSFHKTYEFCREQLLRFETFDETESPCYIKIGEMMSKIGEFLTKYQSNYRRFYEFKTQGKNIEFQKFQEIQKEYDPDGEIARDLHKLNVEMKSYAEFFDVDIDKWNFVMELEKQTKQTEATAAVGSGND